MSSSVKWSDESTREFIQLRYKLRHLFNGRKHQCEKAYSRIVDELGLTNAITATQARKKWSNLLQKYLDIKGGYSTASADWPYFQMLDQIVPLMRKEKIEKVLPSSADSADVALETQEEGLQSPGDGQEPLSSTATPADPPTPHSDAPRTDADGEPPRKKSRGRRAAQRARGRWWGAVEDDDGGSDTTSSVNTKTDAHPAPNTRGDHLDPTHMELQTFQMLKSCSTALTDIRETLHIHVKEHSKIMQTLQQTVVSQGNTIKELLATITSQNAALLALMSQPSTTPRPLGALRDGVKAAQQSGAGAHHDNLAGL